MSTGENKYASTVNDFAYHNLDECKDEISDSSKQVEVSKEPITDTHIVDRVWNLLDRIVSVKPDLTGVGIIGRGRRGITQGMINVGIGIISSNVITDVLTDSSKMFLKSDSFPLDPFKSKTLVIASQNEPCLSCDSIVRSSSEIGDSRIYHSMIGTQIMKKNIISRNVITDVLTDSRKMILKRNSFPLDPFVMQSQASDT